MTTPAVVDPDGLRHLGAVVHKIRPQWDAAGIRSALESALTEHDYSTVAEMFVHTAKDPTARTPRAAYERLKRGYSAAPDDVPAKTPDTSTSEGRCRKCGFWRVRGEQHECTRRADPATVQAARERIRQEATHG